MAVGDLVEAARADVFAAELLEAYRSRTGILAQVLFARSRAGGWTAKNAVMTVVLVCLAMIVMAIFIAFSVDDGSPRILLLASAAIEDSSTNFTSVAQLLLTVLSLSHRLSTRFSTGEVKTIGFLERWFVGAVS